MRFTSVLTILAVAIANLAAWIACNLPQEAKDGTYPIQGLSYNPYQLDQDPLQNDKPIREAIIRDLDLLAAKTKSIRIYNAQEMDELPELARKRGMTVIAAAWLGSDVEANKAEVEAAIRLAGRNHSVKRLIIGNETQLKHIVPLEELISYLQEARRRLRTPVSTAEPWDYWLDHPELADHVDFIAIHILPYWMEIPVDEAVDYVFEKLEAVQQRFPGRVVMIAETGWPSDGPQRGAAEATRTAQAAFFREFVARAEKRKILYNVIEAFDQPWKSALEGRAGEHFGIMDGLRRDKFSIIGQVREDPRWELWALSSMILGLVAMSAFFLRKPQLRLRARIFAALVFQGFATSAVQLAREASKEYMSGGDIAFWTIMAAAQTLLAVILLTDAAEIADVVGKKPLKRIFPPSKKPIGPTPPMVSIHVACCREPPDLMIQTLNSLARLEYPHFEVIVVDNNTPDESTWRPVEEHCRELGGRFRFFSLGEWPGFKAGALNFALRETHSDAEIIGVVDADYEVTSEWLRATVPYFTQPDIAVVQAPQEHRNFEGTLFTMMENDEYSGFFRIGMVQRNEDNAIIQHGTMTLIRRALLERVNGWAEWCICEDAELGLRLLLLGKRCIYIDHTFGRGLVPDSYEAYKKQRFRWAYGGMRIFRRYWKELLGFRGALTPRQRYQFVKGWLPWIGDALHLCFTGAALVWTSLLLLWPLETDFPEPIFIYPALALVLLRLLGTAWTYATRVKIGSHRILLAMIAGGSLTHSIAKAVFQGLLISGKPFYRTPKLDRAPRVVQSLLSCWEEAALLFLLTAGSIGILLTFGVVNDVAVLWSIGLVVQSFPYWAALAASLVSARMPRNEDAVSDRTTVEDSSVVDTPDDSVAYG